MTISNENRKQAMKDALCLMLNGIGDLAFDEVDHDVVGQGTPLDPFDQIPWTTWEDLAERGYVEAAHTLGLQSFKLTGPGWIAALRVARLYNTLEHTDRVLRLRRALVDANKGRPSEGTFVTIPEVAGSSQLPLGWVTNAVLSQLLNEWFPDDHMRLQIEGNEILISPRFGAETLDFDPDE